jgi:hypothetical protein
MTADERSRCLQTIGWSPGQLARATGYSKSQVQRWLDPAFTGPHPPTAIDEWLTRRARDMARDRPPAREPVTRD